MRLPTPPPDLHDLLDRLHQGDMERFVQLMAESSKIGPEEQYLPWDKLRFKRPPEGVSREEWWLLTKLARRGMQRPLPLVDASGAPLTYALPDELLIGMEAINRDARGRIASTEQVTNPATRDRYLVSSLIEEAITSSQLEGASTTHQVAEAMIRSGRRPRTKDERMIYNNYVAIRQIGEMRHEPLTPELICEIQRIVTVGTLDVPDTAGRFQLPGEDRVVVEDHEGRVLHSPPPAEELPARAQHLCDFANGDVGPAYVPAVIRAVALHFMLAYDHPFADGNGRTARALFYWSMLNQGFWLVEFLSISRILAAAPAQYARSFLLTEQDDNDLTHFALYQLRVIRRAITELHTYLERKAGEVDQLRNALASFPAELNHRQLALLEHAVKHPGTHYTVLSHATSHSVTRQTARTDLQGLQEHGLLTRIPGPRGHTWRPASNLVSRLRPPGGDHAPHRSRSPKQHTSA